MSVDRNLFIKGPHKQQSAALSAPWSMQKPDLFITVPVMKPFVNCHVNLSGASHYTQVDPVLPEMQLVSYDVY